MKVLNPQQEKLLNDSQDTVKKFARSFYRRYRRLDLADLEMYFTEALKKACAMVKPERIAGKEDRFVYLVLQNKARLLIACSEPYILLRRCRGGDAV